MSIRAILKKWGNSYGVVIPKDEAARRGIKENDEIIIIIRKAVNLKDLFGKYKLGDIQRLKDELREEWD